MTSSRPYLLRAIFDWLLDNGLTPYVMVDATQPNVAVPERFVEEGKIVLNIAPQAVGNLALGNETMEFDARFSGVSQHVYVPIDAVMAIYAFENGRGMVFGEDDDGGGPDDNSPRSGKLHTIGKPEKGNGPTKPGGKKPNLKIVK